ncbi:MAG: type II toxin-antitoxin system HicA family toxin [Patescibacteria group bacterium]
MSILPILTAVKILQTLLRGGYYIIRQTASHVQLKHLKDPRIFVTVARHSRDITRKTLASILKQSRLSVEEFLRLLGKKK